MWIYVVVAVVVVLAGIYAFVSVVGVMKRWLSRPSDRTAESTYDNYAHPRRRRQ